LLLRLLCRTHDLDVPGNDRLDRGDELVLGDALVRRDRDRVELPLAAEELLRCGDREDDERDRTEAVDLAVLRDADDLERLLRLERRDLDRVADVVALLVRGSRVDDDLVVRFRPAALVEVERVELRERRIRVEPEPEGRPALGVDGLASGVRTFVLLSSRTLPVASATPSTPRTSSRIDASIGGGGGLSPSIEMSSPLPVTTASVPAYESTSSSLKACWTVSVRM
jgi:hypothetical protein